MSATICRVGINAYEANVSRRVGSNMYAYRLLCFLEALTRPGKQTHSSQVVQERAYSFEIFLPSAPLPDMPAERPGWKYTVIGPSVLWTQWRLPLSLAMKGGTLDIFLSLGHYAPRFCPFPSIVCVLDLAFLKFPQFFLKKDLLQLTEWTKYSVKQASHVFTISENSKIDIEREYATPSDAISIIYPGIDVNIDEEELPVAQQEAMLASYNLQKGKYVVSVGTIQPRKNMIYVIKAFEQLSLSAPQAAPTHLVFVGKPGWMTKEFDDAIAQSAVKERILVTGFVPDTVKISLLRNAACSVLVGYYEGFGIPALESLWQGVVPVVANAGSLPEVVGEYGVLVDPYDPASIAQGFIQACTNPPDAMKRSRMRTWARQFSWETSAQKVLDVLWTMRTQ